MTPVIKSTPNTNMNDMMGGYYMSWLLTLRLKTSINVGEGAISWLHLQLLLWQTCQSVLACDHTNELDWSIHRHFHEPGHGNIGRGASVRKPTVWLCARTRLTDYSHSHTLCKSPVKPPGQWDKSHQGGLSMVKIVLTSHFHKKSESHHRSRSHFTTPMMMLYRNWANDLGTKWPNWNTNFARNCCEVIARKGLKFLTTF